MKFGLLIVGQKGKDVLNELLLTAKIPEFVISYSDKKIRDNSFNEIALLCNEYRIKFLSTKDEVIYELIDTIDKVFVIGWQFMLKKKLDKIVVLHDSYLPEKKGWSPTVNYLIEGSTYLAATAFQPTEKMDTGDIYSQLKKNIKYPCHIKIALGIVSSLYAQLVNDVLNGIEKKPMDKWETFCVWRDADDYNINWSWFGDKIVRFINAVDYPYDGAKIKVDGTWYRVVEGNYVNCVISDAENHYGKILKYENNNPFVICKGGLIELRSIQELNGNNITLTKLKIRL